MKAATVQELKAALSHLSQKQLLDLCNRLARFKKENKELLTYLLFEADDEHAFREGVKTEVEMQFKEIAVNKNPYFIKKSLRAILRMVNKHIRYSNVKETAVDLLAFYCSLFSKYSIPVKKSPAIAKLYAGQVKKIQKLLPSLHEDLQYDYNRELEELERLIQ